MSLFSGLFKQEDPHSEYMHLQLELEDVAAENGLDIDQLKTGKNDLPEELRNKIEEMVSRMEELWLSLTLEQQSYHNQDHEDLFDNWRKIVE